MSSLFKACIVAILSLVISTPVIAEDLPVALFDEGHNQRFLVGKEGPLQLSGLAGIFKDQGFKVLTYGGALDSEALAGVRSLLISGAFTSFTPAELTALASFLDDGGTLAVMLHIGPPLVPLLDMLGVVVSGSVIHEQENMVKESDITFRVTRLDPGQLTAGIDQFTLSGSWALLNDRPGVKVIATTGGKSWIDLNGDKKLSKDDALQPFAVIVSGTHGKGRFVVFADDAIFQNQYLDDNNTRLAANLANWLK